MGFKQIEVVPPQISPLQPAGKAHQMKVFQMSRTDTVSALKMALPAQSSVTNVYLYRGGNSDAGTSATLTITISDNSGTVSAGTRDVKANGDQTAIIQMTGLPNVEPLPLNGDLRITAVYAETGTASTSGGPWKIGVEYVA